MLSLACLLSAQPSAAHTPNRSGLGLQQATDSLRGKSGKLRARLVGGTRGGPIRILQELFGDSAVNTPGIYTAHQLAQSSFAFINILPFRAKAKDRVGTYRLGTWPGERRGAQVPEGFVEVTQLNQDTPVSEHFRLRDFLTHDQHNVWPKYLVLDDALVDKLELVIQDLASRGFLVHHVGVLSGFRTPQYNARGVRRGGGRARDSRHQYGDAADVFIDNNRDGRMDDLNGDRRVNERDAKIVLESVDRVERQHPEFTGGAGVYRATRSHGPFVHVDVRGTRARWGLAG